MLLTHDYAMEVLAGLVLVGLWWLVVKFMPARPEPPEDETQHLEDSSW